MATKIKTSKNRLTDVAAHTGFVLMALAATVGMLELPDQERNKMVVPNQPVLAFAGQNSSDQGNNPLRREREESGPHYVSYSEVQRTPGRTGKF